MTVAAGGGAGGETKEVTIQKGPKGFGFSTDDEGVITGTLPPSLPPPSLPPSSPSLLSLSIPLSPPPCLSLTPSVCACTGAGGPAADAGVPAGSKIVAVAGVSVSSKADIIAQLRALGADVTEVQFTLQVRSEGEKR